jgi:hypothetical protein
MWQGCQSYTPAAFISPGNIPCTQFCLRLSRLQDNSAAGRIMSKKNSNDTIGNWTRDLPACNAVSQPTVCVITVRSLTPTPCPSKPAPEIASGRKWIRKERTKWALLAMTNIFGGGDTLPDKLAVRFHERVPTSFSCSMIRDTYDVYHFWNS